MATPIDLSIDSLTAYAPVQRVYVRQSWRDDWTLVPHLHCTSAQKCVAPDIGKAYFTWRFGQGVQPGSELFADWPRISFADPTQTVNVGAGRLGRFVKLEADFVDTGSTTTVKWFGYILESDEVRGVLTLPPASDPDDAPVRIASGTQTLVAYELAWLTTEVNIDTAVVFSGGETKRTNFPLGFNMYKGGPRDTGAFEVRNRSVDRHTGPVGSSFVFSESLKPDEAEPWTSFDVIEYLLEWHSPLVAMDDTNARRLSAVPFGIDESGVHDDILRWEYPRLHCENRTLWDCLTQIIDRRRSQGFYFDVDESQTPNRVVLYPFPYNAELLTVVSPSTGDLITVPANDNQRTLDIDDNYFVDSQVRRSASSQYDEVLMRGGRRRSVFVMFKPAPFATLEGDWSSAEESAYGAGASGEGDYPSRAALRALRNKQVRSDDSLARVYRYFTPAEDWDFFWDTEAVMPHIRSDGTVDTATSETLWGPGVRLLRHLPLFKGWDYSDPSNPVDNTDGAPPEYRECYCLLKMPSDGSGTDRWSYGHDLSESLRILAMAYRGPAFNISIRPQDHGVGIVCDVSGDEQHMLAKNSFSPLPDSGDEAGHFDWQTDLAAVVALEGDCYCEALYPPQSIHPDSSLLKRRLVIDAGDGYRLDYLMQNVPLEITATGIALSNSAGFVRDDRAELMSMARLAYEWYSRERVAIDLTVRRLTNAFQLGHLITTFGANETEESLNSVITSVVWHFGSETGDRSHTLVHTNYAELDPGSFVRRRNG